jgi:hypothetical protein
LLQIDYKAVQLFFRLIKPGMNSGTLYKAISELTDVISLEFERHAGQKTPEIEHVHLMCARGLMMLMHSEQFETLDFMDESLTIMEVFLVVVHDASSAEYRKKKHFSE